MKKTEKEMANKDGDVENALMQWKVRNEEVNI